MSSSAHAPTASERARSVEAVAAHLPKPKTADEIFAELQEYQAALPHTEAGIALFNLYQTTMRQFIAFEGLHPEEADGFAAYLSDALGDSVAQKRHNDAIEGAAEDRLNVWQPGARDDES